MLSTESKLGVVLLVLAGWFGIVPDASGGEALQSAPSRLDLFGDALPPGAIARLGTSRFRNAFLGPHFFPDGKTLLTANRNSIQFWETATGQLLREIPTGSLQVSWVHLPPDAGTVEATGLLMAEKPPLDVVRVWDASSGKEIRTLVGTGRRPRLEPWAVTPDGKLLASMDEDLLRLKEIGSGKELRAIDMKDKRMSRATLTFSPDGKVLAVTDLGDRTGGLFLWDVERNHYLHELLTPGEQMYRAAFTPDGRLVAVTTAEGVHVWEVRTGRAVAESADAHRSSLRGLAVAASGLVVTASSDHTARVWDAATGRQKRKLQHEQPLNGLALSPDDNMLATSSGNDTIRMWDLRDGKEIKRLPGREPFGMVRALGFTPDGRRLFSWADNFSLRIWDANSGKIVGERAVPSSAKPMTEQEYAVRRTQLFMRGVGPCCFSPDGRYLNLASLDGFGVFSTVTGRELQAIPNRAAWLLRPTAAASPRASERNRTIMPYSSGNWRPENSDGRFPFSAGSPARSPSPPTASTSR
jgi:WD40 repeat protein